MPIKTYDELAAEEIASVLGVIDPKKIEYLLFRIRQAAKRSPSYYRFAINPPVFENQPAHDEFYGLKDITKVE